MRSTSHARHCDGTMVSGLGYEFRMEMVKNVVERSIKLPHNNLVGDCALCGVVNEGNASISYCSVDSIRGEVQTNNKRGWLKVVSRQA